MKKPLLIVAVSLIGLAACGNQSPSTSTAVTVVSSSSANDQSQDGAALIAKSDCIGCHSKDRKMIGPSYVDIAKKYEPTTKNIDLMASRIIKGSKGVWGSLPMSPHPKVTNDEAKAMVKYILTLKK